MTASTEKLLLDAAYDWERDHPNRVYMTQPLGDGQVKDYTWAETMEEARRMAAHLRSLDLPPNSNIALISKNCAHFVICDLAIWMAGHATIALYPTLNAETVSYILDHSDSRLVFLGKLDDWEDMSPGVPADMPKITLPLAPETDFDRWEDLIAKHEPISDNPRREPDELCLMCYTSGSTGRPKGVMHSFASASVPAQHFGGLFDITADDRVLSYLPLAHVMERATVECASFYTGTHIYFADSLDTFVQDLHRARPTIFISVPRLWLKFQSGVFQKFPEQKLNRLLKIPIVSGMVKKKVKEGLGLAHVRLAGSGSAPLPGELIAWYDRLGINIVEGYGMTEDFAYSHMSTPEKRKPGYVGVAAHLVETRISEDGEIQIKSPGNMVGYYKQPELTAECYTDDGFFRTGDRGEYTQEGLLRITGRVKELFKTSKGKYVAPVPIENLLNSDPNVELSCVAGLGRPACYAVLQLAEDLRPKIADNSFRQEMEPKLAALLDGVNSQVEGYEQMQFLAVVPDEWATANNFLTPTLKIKRDVIESTYAPSLDSWYESKQKVIWQD
jgi:long-subunit acyl-CoA synthetase (AMP-forming)